MLTRTTLGMTTLALLAATANPMPATAGKVPLWERSGLWLIGPTGGEPSPLPCWEEDQRLWRIETVVENALVQGTAGVEDGRGNLQGKVKSKSGATLKGSLFVEGCGDGKFKLKMNGDLRTASGSVKFPGQKNGKRLALEAGYLSAAGDVYDLDFFVEFAAKKKGVLPANKNAVIALILDNQGKFPLPLPESFVRLTFNFPIKVSKVAVIRQDLSLKPAVDVDKKTPVTTLDVPVAVADRYAIGIKFEPPFEASGKTFRVDAALMDGEDRNVVPMSPVPDIPMLTSSSEIEVGPIPITLKFKNKGDENVHIFLADNPKPFSKKTRVTPGSTKTLKIGAAFGQSFEIGAGAAGVRRWTCTTGAVAQPGSGTVVFEPNPVAEFLSLRCP